MKQRINTTKKNQKTKNKIENKEIGRVNAEKKIKNP